MVDPPSTGPGAHQTASRRPVELRRPARYGDGASSSSTIRNPEPSSARPSPGRRPRPSTTRGEDRGRPSQFQLDLVDIKRPATQTSSRGTCAPPRPEPASGRRLRRMTACRCASSPPGIHGPGLTCHRRGPARGPRARPCGDRSRHGPPPARPRPRRAHEDRARQRRDHLRRPPRPHLGGPIAVQVANRDYANWEERMNPWPVEAEVPEVHLPRPGHADLAGVQKFGFTDVRNVLERASARETAARVAGGALAKGFLRALGVQVFSHVIQIASVQAPEPTNGLAVEDFADVDASRSAASTPMLEGDGRGDQRPAQAQRVARRRLRGARLRPVPGLGSHVSWEERLDGRIGVAMLLDPGGQGLRDRRRVRPRRPPGSEAHDEIFYSDERGYYRETNRAGGVEGGMTNGEPLIVRGAMKPLPTLTKPLRSVDIATKRAGRGAARADRLVHGAAAGVVGEAMLAIVLADAYRGEVRRRPHRRRARRRERLRAAHRMEARGASSSSASWAPARRRRPGRRGRARRAGRRRRPRDRAPARDDDRGPLRLARRGGVPRSRRRSSCACSTGRRAGDLARRRRRALAACATCWRAHGGAARRRRRDRVARAAGNKRRRWPATASASWRCTPSARRSTSRSPTRC